MRYFFRRRLPPFARVVVIESGSRRVVESLLPQLYQRQPVQRLDLVTCFAGAPAAFQSERGAIYRVPEYAGRRRRLVAELAANRYTIGVILCTGEPIMTKWKWLLAARLPVKVLVVNENCDYFWLDYSNWRIIRHFVLVRAGLSGAGAVATLGRLLAFPFTVAYLLLYTAIVHLRRKVRA